MTNAMQACIKADRNRQTINNAVIIVVKLSGIMSLAFALAACVGVR